jgi:hypothetical protein
MFNGIHRLPWALSVDDCSLGQAIDRLCQHVVIGVPKATDGRLEAGIGETPCLPHFRQVPAGAIRTMHQCAAGHQPSGMESPFERIQDKARMCGAVDPPARDGPCEDIDDKFDIDKSCPC